MSKNIQKEINKLSKKDKKIEKFSDLLDSLSNTEDKKKMLWKEVYENALNDRENSSFLLNDLLMQVKGSVPLHTQLGAIMSKYLERMSKSNDQILRLAELVAKEEENNIIQPDEIFNKIQGE
jgi:septal ring factor EnvC (AmiA/AmiB activator)